MKTLDGLGDNKMPIPHKHADLIKKWADGAIIQFHSEINGWEDCYHNRPSWGLDTEYRVKPERNTTKIVPIYNGIIAYFASQETYAFFPDNTRRVINPANLLSIFNTITELNKECLGK